MATLKVQVEELVGTVSDDTALAEYMVATAREVLNVIPKEYLALYASSHAITSSSNVDLGDKMPLEVTLAGRLAKQISVGESTDAQDTGSLKYATLRDPVWWVKGGSLTLFPSAGVGASAGSIEYVPVPLSVTVTETKLGSFPTTAQYAVILGTAIKFLTKKMNDFIHIEEDVELAQTTKGQIDTLNTLYQADLQRLSQLK
tara:strand:- start:1606 stop:2208 length:603 start_codon:yes stop_codon:yes gene_type:complete